LNICDKKVWTGVSVSPLHQGNIGREKKDGNDKRKDLDKGRLARQKNLAKGEKEEGGDGNHTNSIIKV